MVSLFDPVNDVPSSSLTQRFPFCCLLAPGLGLWWQVWQPWVILMCSTLMIQKQSKYLPLFMRRICLVFVAATSVVRCRYRYYSSSIYNYFHNDPPKLTGEVVQCACVCMCVWHWCLLLLWLSFVKRTGGETTCSCLIFVGARRFVLVWPGGVGADLETRRVEVFNYNPLSVFRHHWPHFTIKTSS